MKKSQSIGLAGAAVIIIGTFLPYFTVANQTLTLFGSGEDGKVVAILFIVMAGLSGICAFLSKGKRWISIINLIISGLSVFFILGHMNKLNKEIGMANLGMAVYVIAVGSLMCVISSILGIMKK